MNKTHRIAGVMIFAVGLLFTSGCASYAVRQMTNHQARYYPGVRADARMIVHPSKDNWEGGPTKTERVIAGTLDIVPSAVVDTLCLPLELTTRQRTNSPANTALEHLTPTAP